MIKLLVTFAIFAGIIYYFNIDLHGAIDRSGIPTWLRTHGVKISQSATTTANTASSSAVATSTQ